MKRITIIVSLILLLLIRSEHTTTHKLISSPAEIETIRNFQAESSRSLNRFLASTTTTEAPTTTSTSTTSTTIKPKPVTTTIIEVEAVQAVDINQDWGHCPDAILQEDESNDCWSGLVAQYDWPLKLMLKILYCESQGKRSAQNRSGANGLMQDMNGPLDPKQNMDEAYAKYEAASPHTQPWKSSQYCWA